MNVNNDTTIVNENSTILYTYQFSHRYHTTKGVIKIFNNVQKEEDIRRGYLNHRYGLVVFLDALVKDREFGFITTQPKNYVHYVPIGIMERMQKKSDIDNEQTISRIEVISILKNLINNHHINNNVNGIAFAYMNIPGFAPRRESYMHLLEQKLESLLEEEAKERMTKKIANIIYKAWYDANSNPYNPICKRRLIREFNEFDEINHFHEINLYDGELHPTLVH